MDSPLLTAKRKIPRTYGNPPPPERLLRCLNNYMVPLTLLSSPPGYGKTSLLASWAVTQPNVAWYTLDPEDNNPNQFRQSFSDMLQPFASFTNPSQFADPLSIFNALPSPTSIILNNYHFIQHEEIHQTIIIVAEQLPPHIRLFIASHLAFPLPLSRWRARGLITELNHTDLQLMPDEVHHENSSKLYPLTEGWPAGIRIAKTIPPDKITGVHPHFAQYFEEEVLPLIAESIQEILQNLSVLDCLTPALCETLTDLPNSDIESILKNTPFIFLKEPTSYRMHPLFREYLLNQLHILNPNRKVELHRRAGQYLQLYPELALPHILAAHDFETAARLLTQIAPDLLKTGRWPQLRLWLEALPESLIESHPRLWLTRVWLALETYQQDTIQPYLERFDQILAANPPNALQSELYAIRAIVSAMRNQPAKALEYARLAEEAWSDGDPVTGTYVAFALGAAYRMGAVPVQAEHWFRQTIALAETTQNAYLAFSAHENLGDMLYHQTRLAEAHIHALRAIKYATVEGIEAPFTGWVRCIMGLIAFAWNELDTAQTELDRSIVICQKWNNVVTQVRTLTFLTQIHQFQGDFSLAAQTLEHADTLARQTGENRFARAVLRQRVYLALTEKNLDAARRWWATLNALPPDESLTAKYHYALIAARLQLAEGQPRHALNQLTTAADSFKSIQFLLYDLECHILMALAHRALGKPDSAADSLNHALHLAEPGKIQHLFLQSGAPMRELLRRLAAHSEHATFIGTLLAAFGERYAGEAGDLALTHREIQILRLLAAGFSNRDMAEELVIAESTLKRHVANLYLKMGVHSRTQALARAQEFHLL